MSDILLADDEEHIVELVSLILEDVVECTVHPAYDGEQAVCILDSVRPDLAILDYMMPKRSGLEVLHYIREHHEETVAIVITGKGGNLGAEFIKAGALEFLPKPFTADDLLQAVERALAEQRERRARRRVPVIPVDHWQQRVEGIREHIALADTVYEIETRIDSGAEPAVCCTVRTTGGEVLRRSRGYSEFGSHAALRAILSAGVRRLHGEVLEHLATGRAN
ncbi:MAG: response regulator [Candidatus Schekmanbacteria bacterium]|nr:response regulator [Candidatus Schekmanbacteria bacterium]